MIANPEFQAAGGVGARNGVKFPERHGQAEPEISASQAPRTGGWVLVEGPAPPAAGFMPKLPAYPADKTERNGLQNGF